MASPSLLHPFWLQIPVKKKPDLPRPVLLRTMKSNLFLIIRDSFVFKNNILIGKIKGEDMQYLLSNGELTTRFDTYILDLVKLYTKVFPGDIPGAPDYGFNFLFTNVMKENLAGEVRDRVQELVDKLSNRFKSKGVVISLVSVNLISETKAKVTLNINNSVVGPVEIAITDN